jgi:hypothetical protein
VLFVELPHCQIVHLFLLDAKQNIIIISSSKAAMSKTVDLRLFMVISSSSET